MRRDRTVLLAAILVVAGGAAAAGASAVPRKLVIVLTDEPDLPRYYYYVETAQPAPRPPPTESTVDVSVNAEGRTTFSSAEGEEPAEPEMIEGEDYNYEVVAPPVGATVPYIPEEADEETVADKKYFVFDGTYYRPFVSDGETICMVVEDPRKA